jgi:hypothetical protein
LLKNLALGQGSDEALQEKNGERKEWGQVLGYKIICDIVKAWPDL